MIRTRVLICRVIAYGRRPGNGGAALVVVDPIEEDRYLFVSALMSRELARESREQKKKKKKEEKIMEGC